MVLPPFSHIPFLTVLFVRPAVIRDALPSSLSFTVKDYVNVT
jgi:hypothetical protein